MAQVQLTAQWLIIAASFALQILLLTSLVRGAYRRFPIVFVYSIVLFLTTVMDVAAITTFANLKFGVGGVGQYYRTEALRQILLFAVVMSLIDRAVAQSEARFHLRWSLIGLAIMALSGSLLMHRGDGHLMATKVSRDISFLSVLLTLGLWLVMISQKSRDRILLMVTGGLGLQFTGEAIGQSIRQLSKINMSYEILLVGNLILVGSHLLRLYVWWETFRQTPVYPSGTVTTAQPPLPAATLRS